MEDQKSTYRYYMQDALQRAERAVSESERQSWLTIAESWAQLLGYDLASRPAEPKDEN
jgi:hypothetical protein